MWNIENKLPSSNDIIQASIHTANSKLSFGEVLDLWQSDINFQKLFEDYLANTPFSAFRWETPAISTANIKQDFEFVLLNSPKLERTADKKAFSEHFNNTTDNVVVFDNLSGDSTLIVPTPVKADDSYAHLATFSRNATKPQQHNLWSVVGHTMKQRLNSNPIWLSTAGAGVAWLHIRIDSRPKYYTYSPYCENKHI